MTDQFITPGELHDAAALPTTYCVPRGGSAVRETARSRDDLRRLRGELELLRRIAGLATPGRFPRSPALPGHYSEADRAELETILRDARHPVVATMARLVDEEFTSIRDEVLMSAVYNEAERICCEAADAGVLEPAPADENRCDWAIGLPRSAELRRNSPTRAEPDACVPPEPPAGANQPLPPSVADAVERIRSSVERLQQLNAGPRS